MCFSATASFSASAALITAGVAAFRMASDRKHRTLSAIPLVFGIQQAFEGFLWLGLDGGSFESSVPLFTQLFLMVAWLAWPIVIPLVFTMFVPRRETLRRRLAIGLCLLGAISVMFNAWSMAADMPYPKIEGMHIAYKSLQDFWFDGLSGYMYVACALLPPFLTLNRHLWILGAVHVLAFGITYLMARDYLISVWCFLAAVSSMIILWIQWKERRIQRRK